MIRITAFILLLAAPANAEDGYIDWAFPTWPVGSYFDQSTGDAAPDRQIVRGADQVGYRIEVFTADGTFAGTYWTDQRGQSVAWQSAGATKSDRYTPHDCSATLGICHYVETRSDGAVTKLTRTTTQDGDLVTFTLANDAGTVELTGTWTLTPDGFIATGETLYSDGARLPIRLVGQPFKAK